jgi:hypothetical protein
MVEIMPCAPAEFSCPGAESLAGVLGQCAALAHLDISFNQIGDAGAESLAEVLGQCAALAHFILRGDWIGNAVAESLTESWIGLEGGLKVELQDTRDSYYTDLQWAY